MSKKKKIAIIIVSVLCVILIVGGIVAYAKLPHAIKYDINSIEAVGSDVQIVEEDDESVTIKKTGDGEFRVLMFTDTHLDGIDATCTRTVENLVKNIRREKPDLVLFGGDNVTSGLNKKRCRQLGEIFEKLGVYWGGIIGNHEGDNSWSVSRPDMVDIFSSFEHCLMRKGPDDIWGTCNYVLKILNADDTLKQAFFFLDTGDEMTAEQKAQYSLDANEDYYDGAKPDQVEWYRNKAADLVKTYPGARSILMIHIPVPQYAEAKEKGDFLYGDTYENCCISGFDSGLFDAVKASGTTTAIFCGHDHLNDFGAEYDGVILSYIQPSGYSSYGGWRRDWPEKDWLQGYTKLILHGDGTYTLSTYRNEAPEEPSSEQVF